MSSTMLQNKATAQRATLTRKPCSTVCSAVGRSVSQRDVPRRAALAALAFMVPVVGAQSALAYGGRKQLTALDEGECVGLI